MFYCCWSLSQKTIKSNSFHISLFSACLVSCDKFILLNGFQNILFTGFFVSILLNRFVFSLRVGLDGFSLFLYSMISFLISF
jgi:hypothetical protein